MSIRSHGPEWIRYLTLSDSIFVISIVIGVFALVFLEEIPIRLIGACMVLLSGVFLVMNVSARMREKISWSRPSVSQSVNLTKKVRVDERGTRIVFEGFEDVAIEKDEESEPTTMLKTNGNNSTGAHQISFQGTDQNRTATLSEKGDEISSVRIKRRMTPRSSTADEQLKQEQLPLDRDSGDVVTENTITTGPRVKLVQVSLAYLMEDSFEQEMSEPRREFSHIIKGILQILRSTMNARTAAFFWFNPDRRELVMEANISDVADSLRLQRKYSLGDDIVSHVALDGQAQIVCEIQPSAECDLLPYYLQATNTRSFAAVPVYLHRMVIGVLSVDSAENDAYDEQTIGTLGQCARLISALIQSYTTKYDLHQNARILETIVQFRKLLRHPGCSITDVATAAVSAATTVLEARAAGVVMFSPQDQQWSLFACNGDGLPPIGTTIDPHTTEIGKVLLTGTIVCCHHCHGPLVRYAKGELTHEDGYFVAVPLRTSTDNYGALFIEGTRGYISQQDIAALEIIGEHAGMIIMQIVLRERIHHEALLDEITNTYNVTAFRQRLAEEIQRAHDTETELSVVLLQVDRYKTLEQQPLTYERVIENLATLIKSLLKPYHIIGRLDTSVLGIILPSMPIDRAHMLVEQIRRRIAGTPQHTDGKSIAVTVSAGLALINGSDTIETALDHAWKALQQAVRRSNSVVLYS